ncbi:hypothetical protein Tco_0643271 [Tanacetum coccineum]
MSVMRQGMTPDAIEELIEANSDGRSDTRRIVHTTRDALKYAACTLLNDALTWWNSHARIVGLDEANEMSWKEMMKKQKVEMYIYGLPDSIQWNVTFAGPMRMQDVVKLENSLMDQKVRTYAARQVDNKRRSPTATTDQRAPWEIKETRLRVMNVGSKGTTKFNIDLMPIELGSFDVIISMDWLSRSDGRRESRLDIISCTKTQKYLQKGCHVFLAHITEKKPEDKSKEKRLEDVPAVRDFPKVFLEDLHGLPPT